MLRVPEHPRPLFRLVAYPRRGETFLLPSLRVPLAPKQLLSLTPIHQSHASRSLIPSWGLFLGGHSQPCRLYRGCAAPPRSNKQSR